MAQPERRWDEGSEGELPPDPWAGLAASKPPRQPSEPPPVAPAGERWRPSSPAEPGWHPAGQAPARSGRRSLLAHPAVWIVVTLVAVVALWAAWLERPPPTPSPPTPGSVSTAPALDADGA